MIHRYLSPEKIASRSAWIHIPGISAKTYIFIPRRGKCNHSPIFMFDLSFWGPFQAEKKLEFINTYLIEPCYWYTI